MSSLLTRELVHQLLADHNALNGEKKIKRKNAIEKNIPQKMRTPGSLEGLSRSKEICKS